MSGLEAGQKVLIHTNNDLQGDKCVVTEDGAWASPRDEDANAVDSAPPPGDYKRCRKAGEASDGNVASVDKGYCPVTDLGVSNVQDTPYDKGITGTDTYFTSDLAPDTPLRRRGYRLRKRGDEFRKRSKGISRLIEFGTSADKNKRFVQSPHLAAFI